LPYRRYLTQAVLTVLVVLALAELGRWLFGSVPEASQGQPAKAPRMLVETMTVQPQAFTVMVESFGTVHAGTRSQLHPLVSGQVVAVAPEFRAGLRFRKGDVLLGLDAVEHELALQQARTAVVQAQAALAEELARSEQAERDWRSRPRTEPISDYALRKPQLALARSQLDTARASLEMAQLNLERTQVRAPYDGVVLATEADLGELVGPNAPIAEIFALDSLEVRLPVTVRDLLLLNLPGPGQPGAPVELFPEQGAQGRWTGQLVRSEPEVDARTQQVHLVARIDPGPATDSLRLGQYVRAQIVGQTLAQVLVLPNSVIYQASYVYVVEQDRLYRREVDIRWRNRTHSVIGRGLVAGAQVVTTLLGQVNSGTAVQIAGPEPEA
jgi:RND family efflux transporter MFP subunit